MYTLSDTQSAQINAATYTHDYNDAVDAMDSTDLDVTEHFTAQFEASTGLNEGHDIGGLIVYVDASDKLTAFYDYEQFAGAVL